MNLLKNVKGEKKKKKNQWKTNSLITVRKHFEMNDRNFNSIKNGVVTLTEHGMRTDEPCTCSCETRWKVSDGSRSPAN